MNSKNIKVIVAVDLGGTNTKIGIYNLKGDQIARNELKTLVEAGSDDFLMRLEKNIKDLLSSIGLSKKNVEAASIGSPGPVDTKKGIMLHSANFKGWNNVDLTSFLRKRFTENAVVGNDVDLLAVGKYEQKLRNKYKNAVILAFGTGLGGAFIENGKLMQGGGFGGEFGHIHIVDNGIKCGCGSYGCLEAYVSASGMKKRLQLIKKSGDNPLFISSLKDLSSSSVYELAEKGDKNALGFFRETGRYLGMGLKTMINLFNPEIIILGGGMKGALKYILPEAKKYVKKNAFSVMTGKLTIEISDLGSDSALYGGFISAKSTI